MYLPHKPVVLGFMVMSILSKNSLLWGVKVSVNPCCSDLSWCSIAPICVTVTPSLLNGTAVITPPTVTCNTDNTLTLSANLVNYMHAFAVYQPSSHPVASHSSRPPSAPDSSCRSDWASFDKQLYATQAPPLLSEAANRSKRPSASEPHPKMTQRDWWSCPCNYL